MAQRFRDEQGKEWTANFEMSHIGARGRLIFQSASGDRLCRDSNESLGMDVFSGKADEDALIAALNTARPC